MYAVIHTGGKQIKAEAGRFIDIEKLPQNEGEKISLGNIVMLVSGKDSKIGNPFVKGASVNGLILEQAKADKVIVYKMRPKKGTRKKRGHRQLVSRVFIESIELDGKVIAKAEASPKASWTLKKVQPTKKTKVVAGLQTAKSEPKAKKSKSSKK